MAKIHDIRRVKLFIPSLLILVGGCGHSGPPTIHLPPVIATPKPQPNITEEFAINLRTIQRKVKKYPSNAKYRFELAKAYTATGDLHDTIPQLWKSAKLDPLYEEPLISLQRYYELLKRTDRLIQILHLRVKANTKDTTVYTRLGITYLHLRWLSNADSLVTQAENLAPNNPHVIQFVAQDQFFHDLTGAAISTLQTGLSHNPGNIGISRLLAQYDTVENNMPGAISTLRDGLATHPHSTRLNLQLGYYLLQSEQPQEIAEALQRLLLLKQSGVKTAELYARLAHAYQSSGQINLAIVNYYHAIAIDPGFEDSMLQLGRLLMRNPQTRKNGKQYVEAYQQARKNTSTFTAALELVEAHPTSITDHLSMAHFYTISNQPAYAAIEYRKVLLLQPSNINAKLGLIKIDKILRKQEFDPNN